MVMDMLWTPVDEFQDDAERRRQELSSPAPTPVEAASPGNWRTETPPQMSPFPTAPAPSPQQAASGGGGGFFGGLLDKAKDIGGDVISKAQDYGSTALDAYNQYYHNPVQSSYDQGGWLPALNTASQQANYISTAPGRTVDNALPESTPDWARSLAVNGANIAPFVALDVATGGGATPALLGGAGSAAALTAEPYVQDYLKQQGGIQGQIGNALGTQVIPESVGGVQIPIVGGASLGQVIAGVGGQQAGKLGMPRESVGTGPKPGEVAEAGVTGRPAEATGTGPPPRTFATPEEQTSYQAGFDTATRDRTYGRPQYGPENIGKGPEDNPRSNAHWQGVQDARMGASPGSTGTGPPPGAAPGTSSAGAGTTGGTPPAEAVPAGAKVGDAKPGGGHITIGDILNLPRSLIAGGDASMSLRQSIVMAFAHPGRWAESMAAGAKAFTSDAAAAAVEARIAADPLRASVLKNVYQSEVAKGAGTIASREEGFAPQSVGLIEKAPIIGKPVGAYYRATERGTITQLNQLRYDVSKDFAERLMKNRGETPETITPKTQADINRYVDGVNKATGRGTLGSKAVEEAIAPLSQAFFSWRNALSKPQYVAKLLDAPGSAAWRATVKDQASFLVGGAVTLGLIDYIANQAGVPATVGLDPRSADFGKVIIGNTHLDIWGGFQQPARAAWQAYMGSQGNENAVTSTGRGYVKSPTDVGLGFLGNKLSPQAQIAGQMYMGSNPQLSEGKMDALKQVFPEYRKPGGLNLETARQYMTPLWTQAIVDAVRDEMKPGHGQDTTAAALKGGFAGGAEFLGLGANTYEQPAGTVAKGTNAVTSDPQRLAQAFPDQPKLQQALQGKEYPDLLPNERKAIQAILPAADVQAMKDDAAQRSPATAKHTEILDGLAQKKISDENRVLDAYNSGKLDKEHAVYGMKLAQREYYANKEKADADPAFQKELEQAKKANSDPTQAQRALDAYYQIEGREGRIDFIRKLNELDPGLAARIAAAVQPRNQSRLEQMYAAGELR